MCAELRSSAEISLTRKFPLEDILKNTALVQCFSPQTAKCAAARVVQLNLPATAKAQPLYMDNTLAELFPRSAASATRVDFGIWHNVCSKHAIAMT